jgi:hypothetical protein
MELNTAQRRSKTLLAKNLISEIILSLLSSAIYIKAVRYTLCKKQFKPASNNLNFE